MSVNGTRLVQGLRFAARQLRRTKLFTGMIIGVLALLHPSALHAQSAGTAPADSTALVARVVQAEERFLAEWRADWLVSATARIPFQNLAKLRDERGSPRTTAHVHCMRTGPWLGAQAYVPRIILSAHTARSMCPSWSLFTGVPRMPDESIVLDSALSDDRRGGVRARREMLLSLLDSAASALPGDPWLAGQRVRFLLDQEALDRALAAAERCRGDAPWCQSLQGYVHTRRGSDSLAEAAFERARAAMTAAARCAWDDVRPLLDSTAWAAYRHMNCTERDAVHTRLWWLADPLWVEPGNARRIEQHARRVSVMLRSTLPRDERFNWLAADGGDALAQMILRYGWPSFMYWAGKANDLGQDRYLAYFDAPPSPPHTTAEYDARLHAHTLPTWRAVMEPLAARADDWALHAPPGLNTNQAFEWWAQEHARRSRPLLQIHEHQLALLRRDSTVLLALAAQLAVPERDPGADDSLRTTLLVANDPDGIRPLATGAVRPGATAVLRATLGSQPVLVALEARSAAAAGPDLRTRFSVTPPPPLVAMAAGERALSEPVFLTVPLVDPLPTAPDVALARMRGSTTLPAGLPRVGVYWESYGFGPQDSLDVWLRVERLDRPGVLARVGIALGVSEDVRGATLLTWRETGAGASRRELGGQIHVQARSLVLDVSALAPGRYVLEVAVGPPGDAAVKSRRTFTVE